MNQAKDDSVYDLHTRYHYDDCQCIYCVGELTPEDENPGFEGYDLSQTESLTDWYDHNVGSFSAWLEQNGDAI